MTKTEKIGYLGELAQAKIKLQDVPNFIEDAEWRAVYVVLCTLEGAIMFGELVNLADVCAKFCGDKANEITFKN